jgi:hypothetical protein
MPAMSTTSAPLEGQRLYRRDCEFATAITAAALIGQIKLTRIHVAYLYLPGVRVKRYKRPSLYNVERSANQAFAGLRSANFVSLLSHTCVPGIFRSLRPPGQNSIPNKVWWSLTGSNRRHPACKAGALPAELRPHSF